MGKPASKQRDYDTIIVGGGHNGLTCAAYLARGGQRVLVVEKRRILGGAAVTEEFHPGFRNSSCSYTVSLLHPKIMADLQLRQRGLRIKKRRINNIFPDGNGGGIVFATEPAARRAAIAQVDADDAAALDRFDADLTAAADALRGLLLTRPPTRWRLSDIMTAIRTGYDLTTRSTADQRLLLALATESAVGFLKRYFRNDSVIAAFAFDGVVGTFASPYRPGTAYVLLHHAFGEATGETGVWGHAVGGMGAVSDHIWAAASEAGAKAITGHGVTNILVGGGEVYGVTLDDGRTFTAGQIAVGATPMVMAALLPDSVLPKEDSDALNHITCDSATLRLNVALADLPRFTGFEDNRDAMTSGIVMGHTTGYLEAAYASARRQGYSDRPVIEMLIPSTLDDSLAPKGSHVASLFCQHMSYDAVKADPSLTVRAVDAVMNTVESFAPGFLSLTRGVKVLTPLDLEREYGLTRGDIFHGALSLGQLFSARPILGYGDYTTAVKNLYLCGAGSHPGGGVTGIPGHNCAQVILGKG